MKQVSSLYSRRRRRRREKANVKDAEGRKERTVYYLKWISAAP
jgi:hypothetical protein